MFNLATRLSLRLSRNKKEKPLLTIPMNQNNNGIEASVYLRYLNPYNSKYFAFLFYAVPCFAVSH